MLGHSAAGKTSFMAALYYRMLSGVNDYSMRYDHWENYYYKHYACHNYNYSIEDAINEEKGLKIVCENIAKGIYPPSTAIKQEYLFKMKYKDFKEISFNWFDYRDLKLEEGERVLDLGCGYSKVWRNNWKDIPENVCIDAYDLRGSWADDFEYLLARGIG